MVQRSPVHNVQGYVLDVHDPGCPSGRFQDGVSKLGLQDALQIHLDPALRIGPGGDHGVSGLQAACAALLFQNHSDQHFL